MALVKKSVYALLLSSLILVLSTQNADASVLATTTSILNPEADVLVVDPNYSRDTKYLITATEGQEVKAVTYLKFDISSLISNLSNIVSAKLHLNGHVVTNTENENPDNDVAVYLSSNHSNDSSNTSWDETGFSWAEKPLTEKGYIASEGTAYGTIGEDEDYIWELWNSSTNFNTSIFYDEIINEGYISFMLQDNQDYDDLITTEFFSSENSKVGAENHPYLEVEYVPTPAPEPSGIVLGLLSLAGIAARRKKRI